MREMVWQQTTKHTTHTPHTHTHLTTHTHTHTANDEADQREARAARVARPEAIGARDGMRLYDDVISDYMMM